jgi:hypothetical protein
MIDMVLQKYARKINGLCDADGMVVVASATDCH